MTCFYILEIEDVQESVKSSSEITLSRTFVLEVGELQGGSIAWILCSADLSRGQRSIRVSQVMLMVKNLPATAGDVRDAVSIPGSGRFSGGGHGNPPQCSCLENPMDRGAWQATVHRVAESQTRLK